MSVTLFSANSVVVNSKEPAVAVLRRGPSPSLNSFMKASSCSASVASKAIDWLKLNINPKKYGWSKSFCPTGRDCIGLIPNFSKCCFGPIPERRRIWGEL